MRRLSVRGALGVAAACFYGVVVVVVGLALEARAEPGLERILYVAEPAGVSLYDIRAGHAFLRRIHVPESGNYKGIGASPRLGRLFLSSRHGEELVAVDLLDEGVVWRRQYGPYPDSFVVTPEGGRIYLPCRRDPDWASWVIDAATGETQGRIKTEPGAAYPPRAQPDAPPWTRVPASLIQVL